MDRIIERKWFKSRIIWWGIGSLAIILFLLAILLGSGTESQLSVRAERLTIASIEKGDFQELIHVNGTVMPIKTVYLDAVEGGRVESVIREAGSLVDRGDTILRLSNAALQLDIMNREAQLFEQRNNLRNTRLQMEQNSLQLESQLLELDRLIKKAERDYERNRKLFDRKLISEEEFTACSDEYEYLTRKKELTLRAQKQDSLFRFMQIEMLEASVQRIQGNLEVVRMSLENLNVRAPVSGQLTALNAEVGQSKQRGERLGQIDILSGYKVRADVDEFYITRLETGRTGRFVLNEETYFLEVTKLYPEVSEGKFQIDLEFSGEPPADLRRGQTVHLRLELGERKKAILLPRGPFFQNTRGRWIYVLDDDGHNASRRNIRLGLQNPEVYEVIEGLSPGEQVIISAYDMFGDAERLVLE